MFSFWEQFALSTFIALLAQLKRSPNDVPKFKSVLVHALDDICILLQVTPPTVP